jgi:CHAT domain-containing protein
MPSAAGRPTRPTGSLMRAESRARDAHQRGLRAGSAWRPAVAARHVRSGLTALGWVEHRDLPDAAGVPEAHRALAARLLISLAHYEAEQGRAEYGLRLLDHAEPLTAAADRGILLAQRGLLYTRMWRNNDALRLLDEAVILLQAYPDPESLARVLLNRSTLHLNTADIRRARVDSVWCERISEDHGLGLMAAKAVHNRGYCDLLAGDLPAALRLFNDAADRYQMIAPSALPVLAMDKARALLSVGLANDAARELDTAILSFRQQRLEQDHAEAELARAQAALAADDMAAASYWASDAMRRFRRRGNDACAYVAELTRLRARAMSPRSPGSIAAEALLIADRLRGCGLRNDASLAALIAARALIMAGRRGEARRLIATVRRPSPAAPLELGLLRRLASAELDEKEGHSGAALAKLRAGLATVHARRGKLGSLDLQTGAAALGADLALAGLRLALNRGSAPLVFAWLERSRAQAFRLKPVRPPADPQAAAVLAELRQLSYVIRAAELKGQRDPVSIARRAELQRGIRERSWQVDGLGEAHTQVSVGDVRAALGESGQTLVAILAHEGQLLAVVIRERGARMVHLGDAEAAIEAARRLNADLDTLAGSRRPSRLDDVIRDSIRRQTAVLIAEILAPLRPTLGDGGIVLIPPGRLAGIPWSLLPDLRGRPVTVCPSASSWLAAWQRNAAMRPEQDVPPLLVAGPDLLHSDREVAEIAKVYPRCQQLTAGLATVDATLHAMDGAAIAHLAAHGHHDRENVLFSRLDLADGPLMAYDVQQLASAPRQVILSACDVGQTLVRPGEEVLGFTAALLYAGTATVIASVAQVADDASVRLMTAYHGALQAGAGPSAALASSASVEPLNPFVCFGSG